MYIESQQVLFRGSSVYWPEEIWNVAGKVPKPEGWGDIISDAEADALKRS